MKSCALLLRRMAELSRAGQHRDQPHRPQAARRGRARPQCHPGGEGCTSAAVPGELRPRSRGMGAIGSRAAAGLTLRMRGLRSMLSRATPSRSFSLPAATSARLRGCRGGPAMPRPLLRGQRVKERGKKRAERDGLRPRCAAGPRGGPALRVCGGCGGRTASPRLLATATPWVRRCDGSGSEHFRLAGRNGKSERNGKSGAAALCGGTKGERVSGGAVRCGAVLRRAAWCGAALC